MKKQLRLTFLLACGLAIALTQPGLARVISVFDPGGADAEVREAAPTTPRGTNDGVGTEHLELGMREATAHNGHVYMRFGIQGINAANLLHPITIRSTWALSNLGNARIEDEVDQVSATFNDNPNVAFEYYVLDPSHPKSMWNEATMIYGPGPQAAPALAFDGNFATDDLIVGPGNLTLLGLNEVRSLARNGNGPGSIPIENRLPIGENFDMTVVPGSPLHTAISASLLGGHKTVTIVATLQHDFNTVGVSPDWVNHNYVWNSKERTPLNTDAAYDSDTTNPGNPLGAPLGGSANTAANPFAPQLLFVPEPSSLLLIGLSGLSLLSRRRMA